MGRGGCYVSSAYPEENVQTSFKLVYSACKVKVCRVCSLTTRQARHKEQRWRDVSHGSLEHTDERRREGEDSEERICLLLFPSLQNQ